MSNSPIKLLFVQDVLGRFSEAIIFNTEVGMKELDVHILTGVYENRELFPFDENKITFFEQASIWQKLKGKVNEKLGLSGSHSGIGFKIVDLINRSDADVVCFQYGGLAVNIGNDMSHINKPVCIMHHGGDVLTASENEAYEKRLQNVWRSVNKTIFVSRFLEGFAEKLGCPKEKQVLNYIGIPLHSEKSSTDKEMEAFEFICVGSLRSVKNQFRVVQAFAQVSKIFHNKVKLTLIGSGEDLEKIKNEVIKLGIEEHVHFLGTLAHDKMMTLVDRADCAMLVSQVVIKKGVSRGEEGLGVALLDGASFGLPLIGSRTGGIAEVIEDGVNGFLVDYWDVDGMANAMIKLASDPKMARSMGNQSRLLVEKKFDMSRQLKNFEKIFETVAKNKELC